MTTREELALANLTDAMVKEYGGDLRRTAGGIGVSLRSSPGVRLTVTYREGKVGDYTVPAPESVEIVWEKDFPDTTALERLIFALRAAPGEDAEVDVSTDDLGTRVGPDAPDWEPTQR